MRTTLPVIITQGDWRMKVKKSQTKSAPKYPSHRQLSEYKTLVGVATIGLSAMTALSEPTRTGGTPPVRTRGEMVAEPRPAATNIPPQESGKLRTAGLMMAEPKPQVPGGIRALPPQTTNTTHAISYTVKDGDTLSALALRFLGDASKSQDIAKANPGLDPDAIKPGQVITIPGTK